jgi:hypothetical protein
MSEILDLEPIEAGDRIDPVPAIIEPDRGPDLPADYEYVVPIAQSRPAGCSFRRPVV